MDSRVGFGLRDEQSCRLLSVHRVQPLRFSWQALYSIYQGMFSLLLTNAAPFLLRPERPDLL